MRLGRFISPPASRADPEQFVVFEFEDLHAYAAEYHPAEHRMILDRTASLEWCGNASPRGQIDSQRIETLTTNCSMPTTGLC